MSSGTASHAKSPRLRHIAWIAVSAAMAAIVPVYTQLEGGETANPGERAA